MYWLCTKLFVPQCFVEHNWFHLIGIVCGLAIYNSTVVDLHFPLVLYKKLLDVPPVLDDLKELSPTEGRYAIKKSCKPHNGGKKIKNVLLVLNELSHIVFRFEFTRLEFRFLVHFYFTRTATWLPNSLQNAGYTKSYKTPQVVNTCIDPNAITSLTFFVVTESFHCSWVKPEAFTLNMFALFSSPRSFHAVT